MCVAATEFLYVVQVKQDSQLLAWLIIRLLHVLETENEMCS